MCRGMINVTVKKGRSEKKEVDGNCYIIVRG